MLAYSSIAHAGYILVGVAAVSVSMNGPAAAAAVLYYLVVYAFANVGAFAVAAWLVRDKDSDNIDDLNGLGFQEPLLATCILVLMLSLIGIPPLAGFFGKLYVFMEALNQTEESQQVTPDLAGGARALQLGRLGVLLCAGLEGDVPAPAGTETAGAADRAIALPIVLGTIVVVIFGIMPDSLMSVMQAAAVPMLTDSGPQAPASNPVTARRGPARSPMRSRHRSAARSRIGTSQAAQGQGAASQGPELSKGPQPRARAPARRHRASRRPAPAPAKTKSQLASARTDARRRPPDHHATTEIENLPRTDERDATAMAIINTLQKCLDSPYLFEDKEAPDPDRRPARQGR